MEKDLLQRSLDFIEDNLRSEITLSDIAAEAGFSPFHFSRMFQGVIGMPVMAYVLRRRLFHAAFHISRGMDASEAALAFGFDTYAGFYKAFVRAFDTTPAAIKKRGATLEPHRLDLLKGEDCMISNEKINELLLNWGLKATTFVPVQYENSGFISDTAWYVGQEYVLKATGNLDGFKIHAAITNALAGDGLAAPVPVPSADGREYIQEGEWYFYLLPRLSGKPVNSKRLIEKDWAEKSFRLGSLVGQLHKALKRHDQDIAADDMDLAAALKDYALPRAKAVLALPQTYYDAYETRFLALYPLLPKHVIHKDPNPANILLQGDEFCGFIDFELGLRSARLYDPCYLTTAILSETLPQDDSPAYDKWFEVYHAVLRGYDSVCPLTKEEREAAPYMVFTIEMICLAFFNETPKFQALAEVSNRMGRWLYKNRERLVLDQ